jgi:hypothetical protein
MIKINKVLVYVSFFCFMQYYEAQLNNEPLHEDFHYPVSTSEQELNDDEDSEAMYCLNSILLHKKVSFKKTRYKQFQDKCHGYVLMLLIYYLHIKEQWHSVYAKLKKKVCTIVHYLIYC